MKQYYVSKLLLLVVFFSTLSLTLLAQDTCKGGEVSLFGGGQMVYTCPGDGKADLVIFSRDKYSQNTQYQFVVTNEKNIITGMPSGSRADVEGAGEGICYVWGFAYTGELMGKIGDNIFSTKLSTKCWSISHTRITVIRMKPDGGTISTTDNRTAVAMCTRDGYDDVLAFKTNATKWAAYRYLITDDKNNILAIETNRHNFEGAPRGNCRVWGLGYTGALMAQVGMNIAGTTLSSGCWDISDNYILISRADVDGGEVSANNGKTRILVVPNDGIPDNITMMHTTAAAARYGYIVTNEKNVVLSVPTATTINVDGAGPGLCRIWGISYMGNLTVYAGDKLKDKALATACFDLSKNYIDVVRNPVDGGSVTMPNGLTTRYTCPGDGKADIVRMVNTSLTNATAQYRYIVTDDKNKILAAPPANEANVEGAGIGECRIWGVSFLGNLNVPQGEDILKARLASGTFSLSDNFIAIHRDKPVGGKVTMPDGQTMRYTCPNDGRPDMVRFVTTSKSDTRYQYVVTDDKNIILSLPSTNEINVEAAPPGECHVWGVAYTGAFVGKKGDTLTQTALSDDCFSLSSTYITVNRFTPKAGSVTTTNGETSLTVVVGDGKPDNLSFVAKGNTASRFAWVVTDDKNNIVGLPSGSMINVEGASVGVCRMWGVAYTGQLTALMGDNITKVALSTECYETSTNFVSINRIADEKKNTAQIASRSSEVTIIETANTRSVIVPNPVINDAIISFSSQIDTNLPVTIQIFNQLGNIVSNNTTNDTNLTLDNLPPSIYFIRITQNTYSETHKILKK